MNQYKILDSYAKKINHQCALAELNSFKCPWCNGPIIIEFSPSGKAFNLTDKGRHFSKTYAVTNPPSWWESKISGTWLS